MNNEIFIQRNACLNKVSNPSRSTIILGTYVKFMVRQHNMSDYLTKLSKTKKRRIIHMNQELTIN